MTGPDEPSRPEGESTARPPADPPRPEATGWPGRPEPTRFGGATPGSALPYATGRPEAYRVGARPVEPPRPSEPPRPATAEQPPPPAPVRPPVPTGVPPRPSPLPPPRPTTGEQPPRPIPTPNPTLTPSAAASETVVPEGVRRPAPRPAPRTTAARPVGARGRRAKLAVKRLDPWSVFVTSLVLSLLLGVITIIAAFLLYAVLSALGVPDSINHNIGDITKDQSILTSGKFVGVAALIAAANVLLLTALATIGAMLYNVVATFTGGLELTLSERD